MTRGRGLIRLLFSAMAAVSAVLLALVVVARLASPFDLVHRKGSNDYLYIGIDDGALEIARADSTPAVGDWFGVSSGWSFAGVGYAVRHGMNRPNIMHGFRAPLWLVVLLAAPLPATWYVERRNRGQRTKWQREGRCRRCGYDLRASPDRCPECGLPPLSPE